MVDISVASWFTNQQTTLKITGQESKAGYPIAGALYIAGEWMISSNTGTMVLNGVKTHPQGKKPQVWTSWTTPMWPVFVRVPAACAAGPAIRTLGP